MVYKDSAAIHYVNLTQKRCSRESGQLMIMLKHNQHHQITFSICSFGCLFMYSSNWITTAKHNQKL